MKFWLWIASVLLKWKYIHIHTGEDDVHVTAITFSIDEEYIKIIAKLN